MDPNNIKTVRGIEILSLTADQRFLFGEDLFLRTHYPITMRMYKTDEDYLKISESSLVNEIISENGNQLGNRIWFIYASPGSGKSELMRWIKVQIESKSLERTRLLVRIARHEINPLNIIEKFEPLLSTKIFSDLTHQRWQEAQKKPRTLTKLILLWTLESMLESDEDITVLFYKLINQVQPFVERIFSSSRVDNQADHLVEIISYETWQQLMEETSIEIPLAYEQFRFSLYKTFQDKFLEGVSLSSALKQISDISQINEGIRPILIVDDLVQSMNLYATDLLDYLLSLESGNWDVVVGLTPAALESSMRGRKTINRITYLDTIDDRVKKLWLSDEMGVESFVINEDNCHFFADIFLRELRKINNWDDHPYYPFNEYSLLRIFKSLPVSKGKPRYYLKQLLNIFRAINKGEPLLSALDHYSNKDYIAISKNSTTALITELYGPTINSVNQNEIQIPDQVASMFNICRNEVNISIEPLVRINISREAVSEVVDDEQKKSVLSWIKSEPVNRQMLGDLRKGVAKWIREVDSFYYLHLDNIAKPKGVLKWAKRYLGIIPPIILEEVDENEMGLYISRDIGLNAFDLVRYARVTGDDARSQLEVLANEKEVLQLQFASSDLKYSLIRDLEKQIKMSVDEFVAGLLIFLLVATDVNLNLPTSLNFLYEDIRELKKVYLITYTEINKINVDNILQIFSDYFDLRKSVISGYKLSSIVSKYSVKGLLEAVANIDRKKINRDYRIGSEKISTFLEPIQKTIRNWFQEIVNTVVDVEDIEGLAKMIKNTENGICINDIEPEIVLALLQSPINIKKNFWLLHHNDDL